jgi:hypothetical protein
MPVTMVHSTSAQSRLLVGWRRQRDETMGVDRDLDGNPGPRNVVRRR